jgi:lysophospholipase L1-like esterase
VAGADPIKTHSRRIFFGDSITQAGVGPSGYITRIGDMLKKQNLANEYELIGAGIGGNKIYDLFLRMEDDVLAKQPNLTFVYIGVNDVWHKRTSGTGTDADKFVKFYDAVIKKLQAAGSKVILCTPAVIGEKTDYSNESGWRSAAIFQTDSGSGRPSQSATLRSAEGFSGI